MRIGCLCYATEQGVGYLAKSFYDAGVVTDPIVFLHDSRKNHLEWYKDYPLLTLNERPFRGDALDKLVRELDVMLIFEVPFGEWTFLDYCRQRGCRTVIVPMYEWWPDPAPARPDKFVCPSLLDADYFPGNPFVPVPVDVPWQHRTRARRFLHNAGGIGFREHKGTRELLLAMKYVKSDLTLTVRAQDQDGLFKLLQETDVLTDVLTSGRIRVQGGKSYKELWDDHDVLIAPEKFNGLSLPLQEGRAAGMLVMTTDRYPANTWLPREPLIRAKSRRRTRIAAHLNEIAECVVDPVEIANTMDSWYNHDISDFSLGGREWAQEHSWATLKDRWIKELTT